MKPLIQFTATVLVALALLFAVAYALAWYGGRPIVNNPTGSHPIERNHP